MDMQFYWIKDRVKQKDFFVYWKPGSQNMGGCFTKHHPPHNHREICATYFYMENALLKIDNKIVHKWANAVLTPIHTVSITLIHTVTIMQNRNVLQGCDNAVQTHKYQNSNVVCMTRAVCGSLSVINVARHLSIPRTN